MSIRAVMFAVFVAALSRPSAATAQRWSRPIRRIIDRYYGVDVGIVGGVNRNTATGAGPIDPRYRGSIGAFASFPLAEPLRFRAEMLVTGKQLGLVCPPIEEKTIQSLTWLELPLLLEAQFHRALGGWGSPKLFGGPFVAVRLACSVIQPVVPVPQQPRSNGSSKVVTPCQDLNPSSFYNNGDAGFVVGGGLAVGGVGLGVRWIRSLVPIAPAGSEAGRLAGAKQSTLALFVDLGARIR
jgi:hypothetical protein